MKPRQKRILMISLMLIGIATAAGLALSAFQKNLMFFYSPTEVVNGEAPTDYKIRLGGMVEENSVEKDSGSLLVTFTLTDFKHSVTVQFEGILPDLFREGQGIVAIGKINDQGILRADEVLAKHDENYMPPEVADALAKGEEK